MTFARFLDGTQIRRSAAGQDVSARSQGRYGRRDQPIGFLDAWWGGAACPLKRSFHDVDDRLQFSQHLDEGAIAARGTSRAFCGGRIFLSCHLLRPACRRQQRREIPIRGGRSKAFHQVRNAQTRFRGGLAQLDALEAWPEEDARERRENAREGPTGDARWDSARGGRNGYRDHECQQQPGLRGRDIATEYAGERNRKADDQHHRTG